jgi:hypothetical protein
LEWVWWALGLFGIAVGVAVGVGVIWVVVGCPICMVMGVPPGACIGTVVGPLYMKPGDVAVVEEDPARGGVLQPGDEAEEGGLAASRGP